MSLEVKNATKRKRENKKPKPKPEKPKCGLCGSANNTRPCGSGYSDRRKIKLKKTECCDNWTCDDERYYVPFDYFSSCSRNHRRYTLCAFHFTEKHQGRWQDCKECKDEFDTRDYVDYTTGSFNFEKLEDPEKETSISCVNCSFTSYTVDTFPVKTSNGYYCSKKECQEAGKDSEKKRSISCVNCDFASDAIDTFLKTSKGYYCTKEDCQEAGVTNNKAKEPS